MEIYSSNSGNNDTESVIVLSVVYSLLPLPQRAMAWSGRRKDGATTWSGQREGGQAPASGASCELSPSVLLISYDY